ncbi:hypothetical protein TWF730_002866 [Orbilia blumenaviensis]|uniref:Uncharacterized protein n=1 Tax=Orbilia blumenaviensis TaxID=1796055 RepID=A0AAV9U757_9PEZI
MMFLKTIGSVSLGCLFSLLVPTSAWQQSITTDGSSEFRVKVIDYNGHECHNRNGGPEGVMGIMNTRNSEQLKAMGFWDIAGCDRSDPERYSLFIHWYDIPVGIQLLDLGLPGLEHRWKSFRNIVPNSPTWVNFRNPGKGKYIPGPSGMTLVGEFFADLISKVPPGSIRYRIQGTNEYITVKNAVYVPKAIASGKDLIEDKLLTELEMIEARSVLRGQTSSWFYATGGVPGHLLQAKGYIFQQRISQAYIEAAEPQNLGKIKNPGVLVVNDMLRAFRYPEGEESMKAQVEAANEELHRIEKLRNEAQARKYANYFEKEQIQDYQKYMMANQEAPGPNQGEPVVYPAQSYGQMISQDAAQMNNMMAGYPYPDYSYIRLQQQQQKLLENQNQVNNTETVNSQEVLKADPAGTVSEQKIIDGPQDTPQNEWRQAKAPKPSRTYNNLDIESMDLLDPQYLQQREALKSKSLSELEWGFGNNYNWQNFEVPRSRGQSFDLGPTIQNRRNSGPINPEELVPSIGELEPVEEEDVFNLEPTVENQQRVWVNDQSRIEEEKEARAGEW